MTSKHGRYIRKILFQSTSLLQRAKQLQHVHVNEISEIFTHVNQLDRMIQMGCVSISEVSNQCLLFQEQLLVSAFDLVNLKFKLYSHISVDLFTRHKVDVYTIMGMYQTGYYILKKITDVQAIQIEPWDKAKINGLKHDMYLAMKLTESRGYIDGESDIEALFKHQSKLIDILLHCLMTLL